MVFEVRPATAEDFTYVTDIDVKCFDYPWDEEKWQTPSYSIGVATLRKTPIGMVVFEIVGGMVVLHKLGVRPTFRKRGVSRQLLDEVVTASMYAGATYIETIIPESLGLEMAGWLAKLGFRGMGIKPNQFLNFGQPEDGYIFRKDIK